MWSKIKEKIFPETPSFLIVGLGNPGEKYKNTTHNSGFRVVDSFREKLNFPEFKKDNTLNSLVSRKEDTLLLLPLTFMNLSGSAVIRAVKRFNISVENIIIVHDDNDLTAGSIRFSTSSGSAGHRGVESIITSLKSKDFNRLRIGVREGEGKARSVVLKRASGKIKRTEEEAVEELISKNTSPRTVRI